MYYQVIKSIDWSNKMSDHPRSRPVTPITLEKIVRDAVDAVVKKHSAKRSTFINDWVAQNPEVMAEMEINKEIQV